MKHITVVAAVIINDSEYLCMQRKKGKLDYISYKFEFPGGKMEEGETLESALIREIEEEIKLSIEIIEPFLKVDHKYPDFNITMHSFLCKSSSREPELIDHISYKWLRKEELKNLDWAAADLPIIEKIQSNING